MKKLITALSLIFIITCCFTSCSDSALLKLSIESANAECPEDIGNGMIITKVFDDGSNVVYECKIDEGIYSIQDFYTATDKIKELVSSEFKSDAEIVEFLELMIPLNKGLLYRYYGDQTGQKCDIRFSPSELDRLIH